MPKLEFVAGVYEIRNLNNGKRYIGSAVNLNGRKRGHFYDLRHDRQRNRHLQNSYNKHGESAFVYKPLVILDKEFLILFEQRFLDIAKPEYNIAPNAQSQLGYKHSQETREKISRANTGNKSFLGHKHTDETKTKISLSLKGNKNAFLGSKNFNAKLSESDIPTIRARCRAGESYPKIARDYPVVWQMIRKIGLGISWRHVQ